MVNWSQEGEIGYDRNGGPPPDWELHASPTGHKANQSILSNYGIAMIYTCQIFQQTFVVMWLLDG